MDLVEALTQFLNLFRDLDATLNGWAGGLGPWFYVVLFAIVFCETGLVVTPFLPGDSLLFAVGALAASPQTTLSLPLLLLLLCVAAVLGDAVNYSIGYRVGPAIFKSEGSRLFNKKHLERTQSFYEKYGSKTIVLARFIPIIRTFAPFVAGIGQMQYRRFALFNVTGGIAWVLIFLLAGYRFGRTEVVMRNFHLVLVAIVILSVMPPVIEYLLSLRRRPEATPAGVPSEERTTV
jgi:membrane-associated protein